jgi:protein MpaA
VIVGAASVVALRSAPISGGDFAQPGGFGRATAKPLRLNPPEHGVTWRTTVFGRSRLGVPLHRWDLRPEQPDRHVVVICGLHGDERGALDMAERFSFIDVPADMHYTIVPLANPDGWEAETRHNADNVDLNRNFPWGWDRQLFAGPSMASEPETQALVELVTSARPDLVIWVHQPLGYVSALRNCPPEYATWWSASGQVRNRPRVRQFGGGETWASEDLGLASMLVEVGGTKRHPIDVHRHVIALEKLLPAVHAMP